MMTAELSEVRKIAKEMSLGVMNAKAISSRAGETARGFQPITDFIDEMAREVVQLVGRIAREAFGLSQTAIRYNHVTNDLKRFHKVMEDTEGVTHIQTLAPVIDGMQREADSLRISFLKSAKQLGLLLEDISRSTRGAQVISATSRVEAANAGDFCNSLEVVAENLEKATEKIRQRVHSNQTRLRDVSSILSRRG